MCPPKSARAARVSELERGGGRAAHRTVPMSCLTKCQLRMCPPQTHAGRARVCSGAGLGRTVHSTMSMKCAHQVPTANVPFENARGSRAFSDCNKGMVAPCTGQCRWVVPTNCRLQICPSKTRAGRAPFRDAARPWSLCANSATAAEFPLYPVSVRKLRHCKCARNGRFFKRRTSAKRDCRPLELHNLASLDGEPVGVDERWRLFLTGQAAVAL